MGFQKGPHGIQIQHFESRLGGGHKESNHPKRERSYSGGSGDRQHPCPYNAFGHAPAHRGKTSGGSHADNRPGNGVGGANWNAVIRQKEQRDSSGSFRAKAADGSQLGDL